MTKTTKTTTSKFVCVHRSSYTDNAFGLHAATCAQGIKKDVRENAGHVTSIDAQSVEEALDIVIDSEMIEMGYTHDHVDVHPCCKRVK